MELSLNHRVQPDSETNQWSEQMLITEKSAIVATSDVWIVAAALVAVFFKLAIAYNTFGTNDVATFYMFARSLNDHGLEWTYRNGAVFFSNFPVFNHPPLTAYYLELIEKVSRMEVLRRYGITFPFLMRLPGILADLVAVLVLLRMRTASLAPRIPNWAMFLFAMSPVSLMVSGFHGNTDSIMVMFLVVAAYMCLRDRPFLCGVFFALSCQVKVVPLLLTPILWFFWQKRGDAVRFTLPFILLTMVMWIQPLAKFPTLFARNILAYGSYWGSWGITYCLRLTRLPQFDGGFFNLSVAAAAIALILKVAIVCAVFVIGWRRRSLGGPAALNSLAHAWIVFFVFSPGVCPQYMVWLAPFILLLSPALYGWLTASSSVFLFLLYNALAGGLPWFIAIARNRAPGLTFATSCSLLPWITLIFGFILFMKGRNSSIPLDTLRAEQA